MEIIDLNTQPDVDFHKPIFGVSCLNFIDLADEAQKNGNTIVGKGGEAKAELRSCPMMQTILKRYSGRV